MKFWLAHLVGHPALVHLPMLVGIAAATDPGTGTDVTFNGGLVAQVIQFGFLGAVFIDIMWPHRFLMPTWAHRRELEVVTAGYDAQLALKDAQIKALQDDREELKSANGSLQVLTQEKMIPALVQATEVSRAYVTELARRNDGWRDGA